MFKWQKFSMPRQVCEIEFGFKASLLNMLSFIHRVLWTVFQLIITLFLMNNIKPLFHVPVIRKSPITWKIIFPAFRLQAPLSFPTHSSWYSKYIPSLLVQRFDNFRKGIGVFAPHLGLVLNLISIQHWHPAEVQ